MLQFHAVRLDAQTQQSRYLHLCEELSDLVAIRFVRVEVYLSSIALGGDQFARTPSDRNRKESPRSLQDRLDRGQANLLDLGDIQR